MSTCQVGRSLFSFGIFSFLSEVGNKVRDGDGSTGGEVGVENAG